MRTEMTIPNEHKALIDQVKAAAEKATEGPWYSTEGVIWEIIVTSDPYGEPQQEQSMIAQTNDADAVYIVATQPDNTIAIITAFEAEIAAIEERSLENSIHANGWMEAHDKLLAGKPYKFPSPTDKDDLRKHLAAKDSKIARLREALEPFAGAYVNAEGWAEYMYIGGSSLRNNDLRRAKAALEETK